MGIRIARRKERVPLLTLIYRLHRMLPMGTGRKLRLYLDLEWIFDRLAMEMSYQHYGFNEHPARQFTMEKILAHVDEDSTVLDLGCKEGDITNALSVKAKRAVGVDHDGAAIAKARLNYEDGEFYHEDALEFLKRDTDCFDILILSHILEHLDAPRELLNTFKSHFQHIYIEVPDFDKTYLNRYRKELGSRLVYTDNDHVTEFDREELLVLLRECGIRVLEREYRFGNQYLWCKVEQ